MRQGAPFTRPRSAHTFVVRSAGDDGCGLGLERQLQAHEREVVPRGERARARGVERVDLQV
jgi:hypothetical protein